MTDNIEELGREVAELKRVAADSKEATGNFKEWVSGGLELVRPWKLALILTNAFWAIVLTLFIWFAYMSPDTTYANQDFTSQTQTYADGAKTEKVVNGN